jgi:DNA-binding NarL/FixJ family response regulator
MNETIADPAVRTLKPAAASADRLLDLLSTFSVLRNNGQALIDQIRGSLNEMRALRARIRKTQVTLPEASPNGGGHGQLQLGLEYGLTSRESQVAILLIEGRSNIEIAKQLKISPHTARHHTQRILAKVGVHSRAAAGARLRS